MALCLSGVSQVRSQPAGKELADVAEPAGARREVPEMLTSGTVSNAQMFDDYFRFKVAEFTLRANDNKLPDLRKRLRADLRRSVGDAHARLVNLLLTQMLQIAGDQEFSANTRINAVLVVGELNEREQALGVGGAAVPLSAAQPELLKLAQPDRAKNGVDDALVAAALSGLVRHAESGVSDGERQKQLTASLLAVLVSERRPAFRSAEAQAFFQLRAVHILALLGNPGSDKQKADVLHALLQRVGDQTAPLWLRSAAAESISRLRLDGLSDVNFPVGGRTLGYFALEVIDKHPSRRSLAAHLEHVQKALKGPEGSSGLQAAAQGDQKTFLDELAARVDALVAVVQDRKLTDEDFYAKMAEPTDGLKTWLDQQQVAPNLVDGLPPLAGS